MYIHTQVKLKSVHDVKLLAWMTREKLQVNKSTLITVESHCIIDPCTTLIKQCISLTCVIIIVRWRQNGKRARFRNCYSIKLNTPKYVTLQKLTAKIEHCLNIFLYRMRKCKQTFIFNRSNILCFPMFYHSFNI
jgi:hypothetical protein